MNRLKLLREEKKLTQGDIAKMLNITTAAYSYYENEKRDMTPDTILKLADYFNVSTDFLLGKSDIRKPDEQIKEEFTFAYHKEAEGLTDEEIADAIRFYKQIKYGKNNKE